MTFRALCAVALLFLSWSVTAAASWDGYVQQVEDGSTVSIRTRSQGDEAVTLRFYGIDAPTLTQPYGQEARNRLMEIMPQGTRVTVEEVGKSEYGLTTALVQVSGASVNYQLVMEGLAWVNRQTCKAVFCRRWLIQEHQAVVARRGVWGLNIGTPPWQWGR